MKPAHQWLFLAVLSGVILSAPGPAGALGQGQTAQQQKKAVEQQKQELDQEYTEEEYDAYEKATKAKEPDPVKRAAAAIAFMEKYPKSKLRPHVISEYEGLLFEHQKAGEYPKLLTAAQAWLKFFPDDLRLIAYITEAAQKLGDDAKVIEYGQKLYAQRPSAHLASLIYQTYRKMKDTPHQLEWGLKLLEFPEFNDNFEIRMEFVIKHLNEKNRSKAAEYAQLALKSLDLARKPEATSSADWNAAVTFVKKNCYDVIGMDLYDRGKYEEAIQELHKALAVEIYDAGWYWIAFAQWKMQRIEDAEVSFAVAELLKGENSAKAKEYCERLHKELHNGNLTGIDKTYRKAQGVIDAARAIKK